MNVIEKISLGLTKKLVIDIGLNKKNLFQQGAYSTRTGFNSIVDLVENSNKRIQLFAGYSFACINKIANSVSSATYYVERVNASGNVVDERNWVYELINEINPVYSFENLLHLGTLWLKYRGKLFIWMPKAGGKIPFQMWVLPSDDVTINVSENEIINFTLTVGGKYTTIPKDEIVYIKTLGISTSNNSIFDGEPIELKAAMDAILTAAQKLKYNQQTMIREGTKPYVITAPDEMETESAQRLLAQIRENVPEELRPVMTLDSGKQIQSLMSGGSSGSVVSDIAYLDLIKQICAMFQVPITIIHGENANVGSQVANLNEFYRNAVNPVLKQIIGAISKHINGIDNMYVITYDTLQETDMDFTLRENQMMFDLGIKNRNEIRSERGYSELVGGDVYMMKQGYSTIDNVLNPPIQQMPLTTNNYIISNESESELKKKSINTTEISKLVYFKKYDDVNSNFTKKLERILKKSFMNLYAEILENNKMESKKIETVENFNLFDVARWTEILTKDTEKWRTDFITNVFASSVQDVGGNLGLSNFQKEIAEISKLSTDKITTSLGTIEEELKAGVKDIVESNPNATKNELRDLFKENLQHKFVDVLSESRVNNISQTTSTFTLNKTQKETWKAVGGIKRAWLSQRDGSVRKTHLDADEQIEDENGLFKVGSDEMDVPGGGSEAKENCNCRCLTIPKKVK